MPLKMICDLFSALDCNFWSYTVIFGGALILAALAAPKIFLVKLLPGLKTTILAESSFIIFFVLVYGNLAGICPLGTGFTPAIALVFTVGIFLFFAPLLNKAVISPALFLSTLVPRGRPMALGPLLVIIETVRLFIRPLTLRLRLVANMRAGHVVLGLCSNAAGMAKLSYYFYTLFEFFVCVIQAYIFTLLVRIYCE